MYFIFILGDKVLFKMLVFSRELKLQVLQTYSKNGQVNQQASANRPVLSLLGLVRTLQLVVDPS